jgi:shikimate kinase
VHLVVIGGPIASGKSTLGRVVAARLGAAVVDLDLVYEMVDPDRRPKDDPELWSAARRAAGRLAAGFLAEGRSVVVEGDVAGERALTELCGDLPDGVAVRLVLLEVDFATAFERATADESRGLSKDRDFLSRHYEELGSGRDSRKMLRVDTGRLSVDESADRVIAWLA